MKHDFETDCRNETPHPSILLVSDSERLQKSIRSVLSSEARLNECPAGAVALQLVEDQRYDCILVDMQLPGDDTLTLLRGIRRLSRELPVMLLCSAAEISTAVEGIRGGATDFIIKEVELANLAERIAKVTGRSAKALKGAPKTQAKVPSWPSAQMVVGRSERMLEVMEVARRAASYPVTILLLGESGVGKGLFANWIHRMSGVKDGPFAAVNLAAIPSDLVESTLFGHEKGAFTGAVGRRAGKFEVAQGGTLLLDEITELKLDLQPKLLRVLQEGEFERVGGDRVMANEARIIAATNREIYDMVQRGDFRSDLFYRLNVVSITLPPLRERREDIPDLVKLFFAKYNKLYGRSVRTVSSEAMDALMDHNWPGNIRELEHTIQRAVIVSDGEYASAKDLFDVQQHEGRSSLVEQVAEQCGTLEYLERQYIEEVLRRTQRHQGQAAKILGIDRKTLYNKIMKYGLRRSLEPKSDQEAEEGKIAQAGGKMPKRTVSA